MGCLKRYTTTVDGTIPVQALLYPDEDLFSSQEGVGIYDGILKSAPHQNGTVHITTHRLFYIDHSHPRRQSFALDLSHISRTEYYSGLFTSSSKTTLWLRPLFVTPSSIPSDPSLVPHPSQGTSSGLPTELTSSSGDVWECAVCSYRNVAAGLSPAAAKVCALCGVPRDLSSTSTPTSSAAIPVRPKPSPVTLLSSSSSLHQLSTSLPTSSADLLSSISSPSSPIGGQTEANTELTGENGEIPCPACTFLNHPSLPTCEICGTALPRRSRPSTKSKSAPSSRPVSPLRGEVEDDEDEDFGPDSEEMKRMIKLSFRRGGDKPFYAVVKRSLLGKQWENANSSKPAVAPASIPVPDPSTGRSGINGLLRTVESTAATSQSNMEDALQDLEALMVKAKEMVHLAEDLNERLTAATSTNSSTLISTASTSSAVVEPEEATFIRSSLSQLGLQMTNAPVTLDMIRDERKWVEELSKELAGVLQGSSGKEGVGIMKERGIVALDEVWGGWNRARGVALIPPSTFLLVLSHLPPNTSPPIHMRTFASSGLSVLHTPPYTKAAFASRMVGLLSLAGPRTTVEVAQEEQLPIGLVQEMVQEVEDAGEICRDEGGAGVNVFNTGKVGEEGLASVGGNEVYWWVNVFRGYVWDGQPN